jgi:hypothetical protein
MTRCSAIGLALALATGGPAGASARSTDVLRFAGSTHVQDVSTSFRTDPAAWYTVTVGGEYSFNGRLLFADCGHRDEYDASGWHVIEWPHLDGVPSPCTWAPAHAGHTYCWVQRGTGNPLRFTMPGGHGTDDDIGALVAVVQRRPSKELADVACRELP